MVRAVHLCFVVPFVWVQGVEGRAGGVTESPGESDRRGPCARFLAFTSCGFVRLAGMGGVW